MELAKISHHGAVNGVTGSCHELHVDKNNSILIDCGLFQGAETSPSGSNQELLAIDFSLKSVQALVVTHVHIDHVGRIPYLLAAGFDGPIYCSKPSALLLPEVLQDAVKIGFTKNRQLISRFISHIKSLLVPMDYGEKRIIPLNSTQRKLSVRLKPAGHILGSAYVECELWLAGASELSGKQNIVFSGDLGAPYAPLLPAPKSPYSCDQLVLESTYGDKNHEHRKLRQVQLKQIVERALKNRGVVLIPAFSIGRTQELLYELESIIHRYRKQAIVTPAEVKLEQNDAITRSNTWADIEIIVDSPMASEFTEKYQQLSEYWDAEARRKLHQGRHPLDFSQMLTIKDHKTHLETVKYLQKTARPTIVISASGMCTGGRIVNYLKALLGDPRTDILFTGYQAQGTTGREIQQLSHSSKYTNKRRYVTIEKKKYPVAARIYTLSGYSAHADQTNLLNFVKRMRNKPCQIRLVHGDAGAKKTLQQLFRAAYPEIDVMIPSE